MYIYIYMRASTHIHTYICKGQTIAPCPNLLCQSGIQVVQRHSIETRVIRGNHAHLLPTCVHTHWGHGHQQHPRCRAHDALELQECGRPAFQHRLVAV